MTNHPNRNRRLDQMIRIAEREIIPYYRLEELSTEDLTELSTSSDKQLRWVWRMWPAEGPLPTIPHNDNLRDDGHVI